MVRRLGAKTIVARRRRIWGMVNAIPWRGAGGLVVARKARASIARVTWRCQPVQVRTW